MPKSQISRQSAVAFDPSPTNKNNGVWLPQLTTPMRTAIPANTVRTGGIIYNSTTNTFQGYQPVLGVGTWLNFAMTAATTATGVGLTTGVPLILPSGPRAAVEVAANQAVGFCYLDTTNNVIRTRSTAAWV